MLEDYLKVKDGEDLIVLGIVPKDSSSHLALIALERLKTLIQTTKANIDQTALGQWRDIWGMKEEEIPHLTNPKEIKKTIKPGMKVVGVGTYENMPLQGITGELRTIEGELLGIEWDQELTGTKADGTPFTGHDLKKKATPGHGWNVPYQNIELLEQKVSQGTILQDGVVANETLGHIVTFTDEYKGLVGKEGEKLKKKIPKNTEAMLIEYSADDGAVKIAIKESEEKSHVGKTYWLKPEYVKDLLKVSSLGQIKPLDLEEEVRKQALLDFFPNTVIETDRAERILMGLLMGKDMLFYGPPGSGKSQISKDIVDISKQQEVIFVVDGCKVQCNPFSLFDEDFLRVVPPCPECMVTYEPNFLKTGRFNIIPPGKVRVVAAKYEKGKGIQFTEGTTALNRMHLAGYKIPRLDGTTTPEMEDDSNPEGFRPGLLPRSNNGILFLDEIDKLRPHALDNLLKALEDHEIEPDQLRLSYPAHSMVISTANDIASLPEPIIDRMILIAIPYPTEIDTCHEIISRAYHKKAVQAKDVPIGDTHQLQNSIMRNIPMPIILEHAVNALYLKLRQEYKGKGINKISGSNRSTKDALNAARAKWMIDRLCYEDTPAIVDTDHTIQGIQFALRSRVYEGNAQERRDAKNEISDWVEAEFDQILTSEENTWWCNLYKDIAIKSTQIPEMETNFLKELSEYEQNPTEAIKSFKEVKKAYDTPSNPKHQLARVSFPFVDYLFKNQPGMKKVKDSEQLTQLIAYFMQSKQNSKCQIDQFK